MASILETRISAVKNARSTATHTITLADAVKAITGPENARSVAGIRQAIADGRAEDARKLKCSLQGIMFAGTFTRRRADAITQHSGLMVLDFDHVDEAEQHRDRIGNDPHAVLCFVSPSGQGLKLVVRIDPDAAGHGESFDAARAYFRDKYGLEADPSGRDVSRLCFVSHDPAAIIQGNSQVLQTTAKNEGQSVIETIENIENIETIEAIEDVVCCPQPLSAILKQTQPTQPGQRHRKLFDLARGLRFEGGLADAPMPELKKIVRRWYDMAKPNIGTQDFTESWSDFVHAWSRVEKPLSAECAITAAWKAVESGNMPPEAEHYDREEVKRLVSLCWHLRRKDEFYLSMPKAAPLLEVDTRQVSRWLKMLQADEILTVTRPGTRHRATRYRWTARGSQ